MLFLPNKTWDKLNPIDLDLRLVNSVGMEDGVKQLIVRVCGFELFNTRPYHNYETWSDGWHVFGRRDGKAVPYDQMWEAYRNRTRNKDIYILVSREDLDDAINEFIKSIYPKDDLKNRRTRIIRAGLKNAKRR